MNLGLARRVFAKQHDLALVSHHSWIIRNPSRLEEMMTDLLDRHSSPLQ